MVRDPNGSKELNGSTHQGLCSISPATESLFTATELFSAATLKSFLGYNCTHFILQNNLWKWFCIQVFCLFVCFALMNHYIIDYCYKCFFFLVFGFGFCLFVCFSQILSPSLAVITKCQKLVTVVKRNTLVHSSKGWEM